MTKKMDNVMAIFAAMLNANFEKIEHLYITGYRPEDGATTIYVDDSNFIVDCGLTEDLILERNKYGFRRLREYLTDFEVEEFSLYLWDVYFDEDGEQVYANDGAVYKWEAANSQFKRIR